MGLEDCWLPDAAWPLDDPLPLVDSLPLALPFDDSWLLEDDPWPLEELSPLARSSACADSSVAPEFPEELDSSLACGA